MRRRYETFVEMPWPFSLEAGSFCLIPSLLRSEKGLVWQVYKFGRHRIRGIPARRIIIHFTRPEAVVTSAVARQHAVGA